MHTLYVHRTRSDASPPALAAAWLVDALGKQTPVHVSLPGTDAIELQLERSGDQDWARSRLAQLLTEDRFAGWMVTHD